MPTRGWRSAITRDPFQIALVATLQRLPWLLCTLPAGVITDRVDRRQLVAWMDISRFVVTLGVAIVVFFVQDQLSSPKEIASNLNGIPTHSFLLLMMIYVATFLLGIAEVFKDNAAQTLMPMLVDKENLEKGNGRLWGVESVMNSFIGPPVGGFLLGLAFFIPFALDASTFAISALLVFTIAGQCKAKKEINILSKTKPSFWNEMKEGLHWLWKHPLFRPMGIILGIMNALFMMAGATYILFVQEVLKLDAASFGLMMTASAVGALLGSFSSSNISKKLGKTKSLFLAILLLTSTLLVTGLTSSAWIVWIMFAIDSFAVMLWNVITVSLRQSLIPQQLLGRVNSVFRLLAWGMMPIGSLLGGVVVLLSEPLLGREWALRLPFLVAAFFYLSLYFYALPNLNEAHMKEHPKHLEG